jgi:2-polyprenyl-3-methyl-5-hydroxy-6-metoxy-1,4-benzoquinol methylase
MLLERYIPPKSRVLEVGAGTGVYSVYFAQRNTDVLAVDLMQKHVDQIRAKSEALQLPNLQCRLGDARDLSMCRDEYFDVVLCLGPIYHLKTEVDLIKCLLECKRVAKPDGIIAVAYLNRFAGLVRNAVNGKDIFNLRPYLDNGLSFNDNRDVFSFLTPEEMERLAATTGIKKIEHAATDGISAILKDFVNSMDDQTYNVWLQYHFATIKEPSLLGYSLHALYIGRK